MVVLDCQRMKLFCECHTIFMITLFLRLVVLQQESKVIVVVVVVLLLLLLLLLLLIRMLLLLLLLLLIRITTEVILKGYLFRKDQIKISVFKMYTVSVSSAS